MIVAEEGILLWHLRRSSKQYARRRNAGGRSLSRLAAAQEMERNMPYYNALLAHTPEHA